MKKENKMFYVCKLFSLFGKPAFTLAEVLITLVVIGVVAALTIPSLMALIGTKVTENQQKVFQAKLIQGLNLAKTSGDLVNNFSSTEDFIRNGLARHYKMAAICGANNIRDCIPYEEIKYMDGDEEKTVKVADLKTAGSIKIKNSGSQNFTDTAAFITADGIPVIITYDKNCTVGTEQADREISPCVAGLYDINGTKSPNKYAFTLNDDNETIKAYTYDIRTFNGAGVGDTKLFDFEVVVKAFKPIDIYESVGSPVSNGKPDYCTAAKNYCANNSANLPNPEQLAKIAMLLYGDNTISTAKEFNRKEYSSGTWDSNKDTIYEAIGIDSNKTSFMLWSNSYDQEKGGMTWWWIRNYYGSFTSLSSEYCHSNNTLAICVK